ncbi:uncharacterized protein LOC111462754 [Cucurbita moschata]|uniref:Uncharacterized protein LOC111462754 n=1 Tax=Cucurbita moschata TaxID=3662 RepID=A0A6J1HCK6_CUCMO|nr:uncharacterized protein LOC111462754 [Cucurbita moschata]
MSIISVSSRSANLRSAVDSRRHGSNLNLSHLLHRAKSLPLPRTIPKNRATHITTYRDMAVYGVGGGLGSPLPLPPPPPPLTPWPLWVAGAVLSAILSIWKTTKYWKPFLMLKQRVEKVVHVAEDVVDMVETAAEEVDKVAEEIADHLPKDSILQKTAVLVENTAETVAKDANLAADIIGKVEKFDDGLNSLIKKKGGSKEGDAKPKP